MGDGALGFWATVGDVWPKTREQRDMAQARWRRLDGAHLLTLVWAGVVFGDGVRQAAKGGKARARAA